MIEAEQQLQPKQLSERSRRQIDFEKNDFARTFGQTFGQRLWLVRSALFQGLPPAETEQSLARLESGSLVSESRAEIMNSFTPYTETAQFAMESLAQLIDETYARIQKLATEQERLSEAWRLAAVVLTSGILIQPRNDGNKQTFRLLSLSYIHDLSPSYRSKFFPILEGEGVHEGKDPTVPMLAPLGVKSEHTILSERVPKIEASDTTEQQVLKLLQEIEKQMKNLVTNPEKWEKYPSFKIAASTTITPFIDELNKIFNSENKVKKKVFEFRHIQIGRFSLQIPVVSGYARSAVYTAAAQFFKERGYPNEQVHATIFSEQQIDRASNVIRQLFINDQGRQIVEKYLQNTLTTAEKTSLSPIFQKAVALFDAHLEKMLSVLEDVSEREQS